MPRAKEVFPSNILGTHGIDSSGQYTCTRKNNIKMDVKKILQEGVECMDLGHDREKLWAVLKAAMVNQSQAQKFSDSTH